MKRNFFPDDLMTAGSLNNLGAVLRDLGELAAARPMLERALAIRERAVGSEHALTATGLTGLALLLQEQGDFAAARPLFERTLALREKLLGPDNASTAHSANNLGELLRRGQTIIGPAHNRRCTQHFGSK
jgi:tetratricopeptide (TPR) repeat protein